MRLAVLADIHANMPALSAVWHDVQKARPDVVVCVGDLVGYNAEPRAVLELMRSIECITVAGNHDRDVCAVTPIAGTGAKASLVQRWTRDQLAASDLEFLDSLPNVHIHEAGFMAAHGCYLNDKFYYGYITGSMVEANLETLARHESWPKVAFCGHTHLPLCAWLHADAVCEADTSELVKWPKGVGAVLVNPGSVGQPRDRDPRAAWALVDLEQRTVHVRRVSYDVEEAASQILRAGLPEDLAQRLRRGR